MKKIKMVIGANYGDEGKGLMTDYFTKEALRNNEETICICTNGGAQRGHTVDLPNGQRHVFHHFSSGSVEKVPTYLGPTYMVNPIVFREELNKFKETFNFCPRVFVNENCRITTVYDMLMNRLLEEQRGNNKHGSCGLGIYETFNRNNCRYAFTLKDVYTRSWGNIDNLCTALNRTKEFFEKRAIDLHIPKEKYQPILDNKEIFNHYIDDFISMCISITPVVKNGYEFLKSFDTYILENAQGLLLDQDNGTVNATPSHTGAINLLLNIPIGIAFLEQAEIELCYVTRTYLTRHGAGDFPTECNPLQLNPYQNITFNDLTNIPNPFQGTLRYGTLYVPELINRINSDFTKMKNKFSITTVKAAIAFTHGNEVKITSDDLNKFDFCDRIYISQSKFANEIIKWKTDERDDNKWI